MQYVVVMEFIPGVDNIWVARLNDGDPVYVYDNYEEAALKAEELQAADPTGRLYKAIELNSENQSMIL